MHRLSTCHRDRRVTDMVPHDASPDFGHSTSARGLSSLAQARWNMHTAAPGPWLGDPAATGHCNMQDGRAPAAQKWLQPQSHAPAATHMHTVQKSGNMALPPRKASLPPHCPPCRHPTGQSGHGRRILRAVDRHHDVEARQTRPSRWSSYIDASVTTASGVDLWTRQSVSARSRAYARLTWAVRGSIARSPNGFSPLPHAPSRIHWQLIETLSHRAELRARVQTVHNCECAEASRKTLRVCMRMQSRRPASS